MTVAGEDGEVAEWRHLLSGCYRQRSAVKWLQKKATTQEDHQAHGLHGPASRTCTKESWEEPEEIKAAMHHCHGNEVTVLVMAFRGGF